MLRTIAYQETGRQFPSGKLAYQEYGWPQKAYELLDLRDLLLRET